MSFCKRYIVRSLNFTIAGTEIEDIELLISQTITKLYENEGLILIGGYQSDFDRVDFVLFKEDVGSSYSNELEIHILNFENEEWGVDDSQRTMVEDNIENEQVEENGVLICCLSLKVPLADFVSHLMVFERIPNSAKLYTVWNFAKQIETLPCEEQPQ